VKQVIYLCINLERSPDRRAAMEWQARAHAIPLTFVTAVDGRTLNIGKVPEYDRKRRLAFASDLRPNEIACALSHKKALEVFMASGAEAAVILEDDAVLYAGFKEFVDRVVALPIAWDAVSLENRKQKPLWPALATFDNGLGLHATGWVSFGSAGWLYSRAGAAKVLNSLARFHNAFDTHLGYFWSHGFEVLSAFPPVIGSEEGPSTIDEGIAQREVREKNLTALQWVRWRAKRIEHELRKRLSARLTLFRLRRKLAQAHFEPAAYRP
jgi:glycosyl transferase family 25